MKRWDSLHGYSAADDLYGNGRRLDAELIRCVFLVVYERPPGAQVGFTAPSKVFNAVKRNRLKRLMREAFAREWPNLFEVLERAGCAVSLLFVFKGKKKGMHTSMVSLTSVHASIASLCSTLRATL